MNNNVSSRGTLIVDTVASGEITGTQFSISRFVRGLNDQGPFLHAFLSNRLEFLFPPFRTPDEV